MATTQEYIEFVCNQIENEWNAQYRKMFGEYMVYVHSKPLLLVCDNTVYVRQLDSIEGLMESADKGFPYKGAKEHYIVDVEDRPLLNQLIEELEKVIPVPVKKKPKKKKGPAEADPQ